MNQSEMILEHLQSGKTITPLESLELFGCFRLGARIFDLKKQGYSILTEPFDLPDGKRVARYKLA